jgi:murein DD-endopeptidase MepM/ murein hydrolase activator NlpD
VSSVGLMTVAILMAVTAGRLPGGWAGDFRRISGPPVPEARAVAWAELVSVKDPPMVRRGARFEKVVGRLVEAINAEDYPRIQEDFSPGMRDALPPEKAEPFFRGLVSDCGKVEKLGAARLVPPNQAVFPVHFERAVLDLTVVLDREDKIAGLWVRPHRADIPAPEKNTSVLRLPFEGRWRVQWGGATRELNQHHDTPNQRYAFDFLVTDERGQTHKGEGTQNEDYYAFGRKVLAPADGLVTDVIRGVRDNRPGSMNPYSALGNAVFIRHAEHEVSVLAHLQQGSIRVKAGDKVKVGQVLGLCGNSGNSSEPHLHYHLQNTPIIQDGTGIRCFFETVLVTRDGTSRSEQHYSPVKDDIVEQERQNASECAAVAGGTPPGKRRMGDDNLHAFQVFVR